MAVPVLQPDCLKKLLPDRKCARLLRKAWEPGFQNGTKTAAAYLAA
jgi:hypothetical protein